MTVTRSNWLIFPTIKDYVQQQFLQWMLTRHLLDSFEVEIKTKLSIILDAGMAQVFEILFEGKLEPVYPR